MPAIEKRNIGAEKVPVWERASSYLANRSDNAWKAIKTWSGNIFTRKNLITFGTKYAVRTAARAASADAYMGFRIVKTARDIREKGLTWLRGIALLVLVISAASQIHRIPGFADILEIPADIAEAVDTIKEVVAEVQAPVAAAIKPPHIPMLGDNLPDNGSPPTETAAEVAQQADSVDALEKLAEEEAEPEEEEEEPDDTEGEGEGVTKPRGGLAQAPTAAAINIPVMGYSWWDKVKDTLGIGGGDDAGAETPEEAPSNDIDTGEESEDGETEEPQWPDATQETGPQWPDATQGETEGESMDSNSGNVGEKEPDPEADAKKAAELETNGPPVDTEQIINDVKAETEELEKDGQKLLERLEKAGTDDTWRLEDSLEKLASAKNVVVYYAERIEAVETTGLRDSEFTLKELKEQLAEAQERYEIAKADYAVAESRTEEVLGPELRRTS